MAIVETNPPIYTLGDVVIEEMFAKREKIRVKNVILSLTEVLLTILSQGLGKKSKSVSAKVNLHF